MVADSGVPLVLTGRQAPWLEGLNVRRVVVQEAIDQEQDDSRPHSGVCPANLAYMIYTTGSTGRPKGALNEHRGIVNRLLWMQQQYRLDAARTACCRRRPSASTCRSGSSSGR